MKLRRFPFYALRQPTLLPATARQLSCFGNLRKCNCHQKIFKCPLTQLIGCTFTKVNILIEGIRCRRGGWLVWLCTVFVALHWLAGVYVCVGVCVSCTLLELLKAFWLTHWLSALASRSAILRMSVCTVETVRLSEGKACALMSAACEHANSATRGTAMQTITKWPHSSHNRTAHEPKHPRTHIQYICKYMCVFTMHWIAINLSLQLKTSLEIYWRIRYSLFVRSYFDCEEEKESVSPTHTPTRTLIWALWCTFLLSLSTLYAIWTRAYIYIYIYIWSYR